MAYFGSNQTALLSYDSGGSPATAQTPDAKVITSTDNTPEDQVFGLTWDVVQAGGAGSPTLTINIYGSPDGTNWILQQQITTNGTTTGSYGNATASLFKYAKATLTPGGSTAPSCVAKVWLGWSGQASIA